ncbi:hypothetical protein AOC36_06975 [Erysipelothrix larvae]|uniref:Uncharacterized protein n=1 Tax=Erysipelothrix larvae TaxID=1514105 RepID=A0A0X8H0Q5_9FIRM|nr:hypothetical protein [Erysipelothrix larvae]AMC93734.1 hypothetical protein AOC36_06975 [Erysipelothrix larvae]
MKIKRTNLILLLVGIPLTAWRYQVALGWLIGQFVMILIEMTRTLFYDQILTRPNFRISQYIMYVLFTIIIIAGPLLFSFYFRGFVEPLAIFAAYFSSRILMFLNNIFSKGKEYHAS